MNDRKDEHAGRRDFIQDDVWPMLVTPDAAGDGLRCSTHARVIREELKRVLQLCGIGFCLPLPEQLVAE